MKILLRQSILFEILLTIVITISFETLVYLDPLGISFGEASNMELNKGREDTRINAKTDSSNGGLVWSNSRYKYQENGYGFIYSPKIKSEESSRVGKL